jgi:hypothetical protein
MVDGKREDLVAMFAQLKDLQIAAGVTENTTNEHPILDNETEYDEYEDSIPQTVTDLLPIERKTIVLPSNGNTETNVSVLEIKFRISQAQTQLNQLRELIADISFQFSHVIRGQIRKNVRTRSQKRVKSLHNQLTLHARIYTRARNHLVALNCEQSILGQFRELKREDLKSSTAILDPNEPGSTSLKLSWIWHSGKWLLMQDILMSESGSGTTAESESEAISDPGAGPGPGTVPDAVTLHECMLSYPLIFLIFIPSVKRVHFLRVRALKKRWQEEHMLLIYEMQWTVRFFKNKAEKWRDGALTPDISTGAKAYALRQEARWIQMSLKSDKLFKKTAIDYVTPII